MRIIAGERKGMNLYGAKDKTVRPTMDYAKEALFSLLTPLKEGACVLDLFGGTGAVGLEFLSRGAKQLAVGELRGKNIEIIKTNVDKTKYQERVKIYPGNFKKTVHEIAKSNCSFDYIFLDPPYHSNLAKNALCEIEKYGILKTNGRIIVEVAKDEKLLSIPFLEYDCRAYGQTKFLFFKREGDYENNLSREF